ncbi:Hpt domain protein [Coleofasciculus chthonoplastes PCC 7420]|uniref:histidine kinase n=1 Tax=Coleofasciculus chthonoplastes PCC 7420 TaxID=118168 RepID=B4VWP0_9CYAN|nr:Hpt domain-containing protein [Coleofasciculus chthonoplastes]EDX73656.1 Hpt domain protein [Coleofasciculus chthonoplastes PCC 7420]
MIIDDEELRTLYKTAGEERLEKLTVGLHHLQKNPENETTLEQLLRDVHSLKGDSKSLGVKAVETLADRMEWTLGRIKRQKLVFSPSVSQCLDHVLDAIRLLIAEAITGKPSGVNLAEILDQFKQLAIQPAENAAAKDIPPEPLEREDMSAESSELAESYIDDDELRDVYQLASRERLQSLEAGLRHLTENPDDEAIWEQLRREAHSIKGDSRSVGVETVEILAHPLEEIIENLKSQPTAFTPDVSQTLHQGVEAITQLVQEAVTGKPSAVDTTEVLEQFMLVLENCQSSTVASPIQEEAGEAGEAGEVYPSRIDPPPQLAESYIDDDELREVYQLTSGERLHSLETGLNDLAQNPDNDAIWEELRREVHSLKGDSRSVGVESVEILAHPLEEIIENLKSQPTAFTPDVNQTLHQGVEAISKLVQEAITGQPSAVDTTQVLEQFMLVLEDCQQSAVASPSQAEPGLVGAGFTDTLEPTTDNGTQPTSPQPSPPPQLAESYIDDDELREVYQLASSERLQILEAGLLHLEKYPDDQATLDQLLREAHSLKGDSRSVGVESVETLVHHIEEVFDRIKHRQLGFTVKVSESLYDALEAIRGLVEEAVTGQPQGVDTAQVLNQLIDAIEASAQSPPVIPVSETPTPLSSRPDSVTIVGLPNVPSSSSQPPLSATFIDDEEMRDVYKLASLERLQKLEAGLLQLEKQPDDSTTLDELLREAHSLKGDSRSAGVEPVEALIHHVEEILGGIKLQPTILTPDISDRLYRGLDAMGKLVQEAVTGQYQGVNTTAVLNQLLDVSLPSLPDAGSTPVKPLPTQPPVPKTPALSDTYRIDTIRVPTRDLDGLMAQAEELNVTKLRVAYTASEIEELVTLWQEWKAFYRQSGEATATDVNPFQERLDEKITALRTATQENTSNLDLIAEDLRERIQTLRQLPLSTIFQLFPRMVRDLARKQSKQVELIIEGGETTADKTILEDIKDSLTHLIRNAIDHGIETPAEREKLGKPPVAKIWLRGSLIGNTIIIEVADDGRGLDIDQIKQTAIKRKLYQPDELERMNPSQIYDLIFTPGFSTRSFITEISGRGIGLDVVKTNIERLKGAIAIESTPNQGSTFRIQLRTTLATVNALFVEVQGIVQALPIEFVQTSLLLSPDEIETVDGRETLNWQGQRVPVANLANVLELSNSPAYALITKKETPLSELRSCILLKVGDEVSGFLVDRLLDTQEIPLKPQSTLLKRVKNILGATILPTGDVCMILNPADLVKSGQQQSPATVSVKANTVLQTKPTILLVEDSLPVRTQERRLLEGAGYEVVIAVDGLDGYTKLKSRHFDAVVSDVEMPHLDGLSLTATIRQHSEYQDLPIILVTTLDSEADQQRGAEAGADAYIIKGKFNQAFLLETISRLV